MPSRDSRWEHDEDLRRYGMDPDPWWAGDYYRELYVDRDVSRWVGPLHPSVADRSFGESSDEEDGDA